ncbi:MAG TPA: tetratricopeptide repeat protein [Planctomycetota bacterium]|nr:tetratricopeptide repeat protein [Planctomycetota bacterium]
MLGYVYSHLGQWPDAEVAFQRARAEFKKLGLERDPRYAPVLNNLALIFHQHKNADGAEEMYTQALALLDPKTDPGTFATTLQNRANIRMRKGHMDEAEQDYTRAIEACSGSDDAILPLDNRGALRHERGRDEEAAKDYRQAVELAEHLHAGSPNHPTIAIARAKLGEFLRNTRRFEEAEPLLLAARTALEATYGSTPHADVAYTLEQIAELLDATGRASAAAPVRAQAKALRERLPQANR